MQRRAEGRGGGPSGGGRGRGEGGRGRGGGPTFRRGAGSFGRGGGAAPAGRRSLDDASPAERAEWLAGRVNTYDTPQLVYELAGPQNDSWIRVVESAGANARCLSAVLTVLTGDDVMRSPGSARLFNSLVTPEGLRSLLECLNRGPLSVVIVRTAERGTPAWIDAVDLARRLCVAFCESLRVVPNAAGDSLVMAVVGPLFERVTTLADPAPGPNSPADVLLDWSPAAPAANRENLCLLMRRLHAAAAPMMRAVQAANDAHEARLLLESERATAATQRLRGGRNVLDGEATDTLYHDMGILPSVEELLARQPPLLPRIRGVRLGGGAAGGAAGNAEDEEAADAAADAQAAAAAAGAPPAAARDPPYRSKDHLLNTHFLLLREEAIAGLRRGIASFGDFLLAEEEATPGRDRSIAIARASLALSRSRDRIAVFTSVRIVGVGASRAGIAYEINFTPTRRVADWSRSRLLNEGSLVCLGRNGNFQRCDMLVATIAYKRAPPPNASQRLPRVGLAIDPATLDALQPGEWVMLEAPTYFEATRHVLRALQDAGAPAIAYPFLPLLTGARPEAADLPAFPAFAIGQPRGAPVAGWDVNVVFSNFAANFGHGSSLWNPGTAPNQLLEAGDALAGGLDESQRMAVQHALTREIALIQGPPGTGKTYTGEKVTQILLESRTVRNEKKPILFICQTNHALDQMLELVHAFEKRIVRLGARSQSDIMSGLTLQKWRERQGASASRLLRTPQEREALTSRRRATLALEHAYRQQHVASALPDSSLARLLHITRPYGIALENLVTNPRAVPTLNAAHIAASNVVRQLLATMPQFGNMPHAWCVGGDAATEVAMRAWVDLKIDEQLLALAAYVPPESVAAAMEAAMTGDIVNNSLISAWLRYEPRRAENIARAVLDPEGFEVVGGRRRRGGGATGASEYANPVEPIAVDEEEDGDDGNAGVIDGDIDVDADPPLAVGGNGARGRADITCFKCGIAGHTAVVCRMTPLESDLAHVRAVVYAGEIRDGGVDGAAATTLSDEERELLRTADPWSLDLATRRNLANIWRRLLADDVRGQFAVHMQRFKEADVIDRQYEARLTAQLLQDARVVGATTTGAAKFSELLRQLAPEIIIVEEAAEVLEAHVLAALTRTTKHVILIGDHRQLRPTVAEYRLARDYSLDISLFERLVSAAPRSVVTLTTQRRMHPDIRRLIAPAPDFYARLDDGGDVNSWPPVPGVARRLAFIDHEFPEGGSSGADNTLSRVNLQEAAFAARLAQHLLLNSVAVEDVVILTMYQGQVATIRDAISRIGAMAHPSLVAMRVKTVDNFQVRGQALPLPHYRVYVVRGHSRV